MATLGETLQQAREQMGVSLDEAERETRIRSKILAAFEDDNQAELPAPVYARGLLRNYANYLGVEPDSAVEMYDAQSNNGKGRRSTQPVMNLAPAATGEVRTTLRYPPGILAVFIVLVLGIFIVIVGSNILGFGRKTDPQSSTIPTPRPSTPTTLVALATSTQGVVAFLPTPTNAGGSKANTTPSAGATVTTSAKVTATPAPPNPNLGIGTPVVGGGIAASPTPTRAATAKVTPSPTFAPTTPGNGVQVTMIAVADSWAQVTVDGIEQFKGTIASGSRRTFTGDSTVYVWVGNGGGIQVVVNGQNRGTLGTAGQVVKRQWDANGNETAGL